MSFTNDRLGWEDLEIFFHVAESGGLSAASRLIGLSPPTVGRRMLALEQRAGQTLFNRAQTGYSLTPAGQSLLERVRVMHAAAVPAHEVLLSQAATPLIRLSAGTATAHFLADKYSLLSRRGDGFRLNFVTTEATLDIAHREIDLGIRNRPADAGNLASRRLGTLRFAPYRSWAVAEPAQLGWVALDPVQARHPAAHWLHRQDHVIAAMANTVATVQELVRAGAGIGVMPCMIGDCDLHLCRAGPVIEELTEQQYLVMHDDDRHRPPIRRLIERIVNIYADNADLLSGERPLRGEGAG
ncbi:LysR family transcriptional regulator [Roseicitreum antarcticum]|uniref:DNA-binding transcriptional regulator, LysR family n=1 Tax=Roseicitreum antarcticum TaxID=564137 RepID=A0A1H2TNE2_9RHOB|nr:LysR family transcriptional regulator [Roseicitreum antarcticum]SDW45298.1 DNA-binding transcriptional regulator, LysR family [Roseicitreum antarcticum]